MLIRYLDADPAGNRTGLVLTPVAQPSHAALAAALMARCAEGFEQIGFIDEASVFGPLPRMDMMGGEFCGNATRAFGFWAARMRGRGERTLRVRVSGAAEPVRVQLDPARGEAYADMPLPLGLEEIDAAGRRIPLIHMEGIDHALLLDAAPSPALADAVLACLPPAEAQGVLFAQGLRMTPLVHVAATHTRVWESSCGSGSVALAWFLARQRGDGEHVFPFAEPGGALNVRIAMEAGRALRAVMGGEVRVSEVRQIEI